MEIFSNNVMSFYPLSQLCLTCTSAVFIRVVCVMIMSSLFTRTLSIIQFVSLAAISAFHRQHSVCAHSYKIENV